MLDITQRQQACLNHFGMMLLRCPFCGGRAVIDSDEDPGAVVEQTQYYTLGCITAGCREYIYAQTQNIGYPTNYVRAVIECWNRRPEEQ